MCFHLNVMDLILYKLFCIIYIKNAIVEDYVKLHKRFTQRLSLVEYNTHFCT